MSVSYPLKKANIHMPKQLYKRENHSNIMSLEQIFPESIKSSLNKVLFKKTVPIQDRAFTSQARATVSGFVVFFVRLLTGLIIYICAVLQSYRFLESIFLHKLVRVQLQENY